jgi:hypothetical protein
VVSYHKYKYFVNFKDDFTSYTWVVLLREKLAAITALKQFMVSRTQSTTSSITSSKSKVPQVNPVIRPARDPEKQETRAKPSGDLVSCDRISNRSPDPSRVLSCDKSRDSIRFGWARSPLINKWQTVGTVHNQRRHVTPVIG